MAQNQCAYPGCTNELVSREDFNKQSVLANICHIYAAADDGPRGNAKLTTKQRNSYENLILLCAHHHTLVDGQHEAYPAGLLQRWKREHEAKAQQGTPEALKQEAAIQKHAFIAQMTDGQIEVALNRIRRARVLHGFEIEGAVRQFAQQVDASIYSAGSNPVKARALAWCARLLVAFDSKCAEELLEKSKLCASTPDALYAKAFIVARSDRSEALALLGTFKTAAAASVAFRIVTNADGPGAANRWLRRSGITFDDLDSEGRFLFLGNALTSEEWDTAISFAPRVTEDDFVDCPAIMNYVAAAYLITAVPKELRAHVILQVPFEADTFLLGSSTDQLAARSKASALYQRVAAFALDVGCVQGANVAADYSLWLRLRDPETKAAAICELRDSMRDPVTSIRRVPLALAFGVKVDLGEMDERIERNIALTGKGSATDAMARFALAFAQGSHKAAAEYLNRHRALLEEHLESRTIQCLEIEVLAKAGLLSTAQEKLQQAIRDGLSARDQQMISAVIAEAAGKDPITERREFYESTLDLRGLVNLATALERAGLWQDLESYATTLFQRTNSVEACETLARCLNQLGKYGPLYELLYTQGDLVNQSQYLKEIWAWTLYREGRFGDAEKLLKELRSRDDINGRALQINIAIASGQWDKLVDYTNWVWAQRKQLPSQDILQAGQLAIATMAPHARDLVHFAAEHSPDDPEVLAGAYFQAAAAGWEQNEVVAGWLNRAASLSGDDGPIKPVSLRELVEQKPQWDRRAEDILDSLRTGKIPNFGAAQFLNRSLLDLYLLNSLANARQIDPRKRNVIFAYHGAREPVVVPSLKTIALDLASIVTFARLGLLKLLLETYVVLVPHSTLGWLFQEQQKARFHQPSRIMAARQLKQLIGAGGLYVLRGVGRVNHSLVREVGSTLAELLCVAKERVGSKGKAVVVKGGPILRVGSMADEEANIAGYEKLVCSGFAVIDWLKRRGVLTLQEEQSAKSFMRLQERAWPEEAAIERGTELYLDEVAVSHFQTIGLLEKLKAADVKCYIHEKEDEEANALLDIESLISEQLDIIECIRSELATGLETGRVRAVRSFKAEEDDTLFKMHPTFGVLALVEPADAIIVDDRFLNQHRAMTFEGRVSPVLCSLDVLDCLCAQGRLTQDALYACRTKLRQSGYLLLGVTPDELSYYLARTAIEDGCVVETAELRAIRESLLRARMSKIVQIPEEVPYIQRTVSCFIHTAKRAWLTASTYEQAKAIGEYLLSQAQLRHWAPSALEGNEKNFAEISAVSFAFSLLSAPEGALGEVREAYFEWVTERFLVHMKKYQRAAYEQALNLAKRFALDLTENVLKTVEAKDA